MIKTLGFASIPAVQQYLRYAERQGVNCQHAIKQAGIDPLVLKNENGRIKGELFQDLIKALIQASNDPLMGLNSSQFVQPGSYSVQGYIMMSCATIGEAIERIPPYEKLVGDMGITTIHTQATNTRIQWHCAYPDPQVRRHMIDNVLASWTNFARWLANADTSAEHVLLEHSKPEQTQVEQYQKFFKCKVDFDAKENSIVLANALLSTPLRQPDKLLLKTLESHAENQISSLQESTLSFSIKVSHAIRAQLALGTARKELIADELNITPRTLQRRLAEEGSSYQAQLDQIRVEMASEMLSHTHLGIQDIAYNLGFSDGRSFHRSFKNWTGLTPGKFRKNST